ncbi:MULTISPECIES: energy-coupling factor transporter transmembrane protein EcfT [Methanothermobacter]|uniref:energy-coupling factor transporter transmembrane component T family protein n=1 Tax=Methanothermobacter TaxID=145260 RepID=UPI00136659CE|nr:CbiQ family ECF transporter T component [Methanothermobacter sp. THM-2]
MDLNRVFSPFTTTETGFFGEINPLSKVLVVLLAAAFSVLISRLWILVLLGAIFTGLLASSGSLRAAAPFLSFIALFWVLSVVAVFLTSGDMEYALGFLGPFFARFFILVAAGLFFAFTTSPRSLAEALRSLHVPGEIVFTLTVALRYIPALAVEASSIWDSLKLRLNASGLSVARRPSLIYRGLIIPLIIRVVKISDEVAVAAETRAFDPSRVAGGKMAFSYRDAVFLLVSGAIFTLLGLISGGGSGVCGLI